MIPRNCSVRELINELIDLLPEEWESYTEEKGFRLYSHLLHILNNQKRAKKVLRETIKFIKSFRKSFSSNKEMEEYLFIYAYGNAKRMLPTAFWESLDFVFYHYLESRSDIFDHPVQHLDFKRIATTGWETVPSDERKAFLEYRFCGFQYKNILWYSEIPKRTARRYIRDTQTRLNEYFSRYCQGPDSDALVSSELCLIIHEKPRKICWR